jgi:hypothetical protein
MFDLVPEDEGGTGDPDEQNVEGYADADPEMDMEEEATEPDILWTVEELAPVGCHGDSLSIRSGS